MENLKPLNHDHLRSINGGFVPVVIFGATYSAKAVAGYFGAVAAASSGITLAALGDNKDEPTQ